MEITAENSKKVGVFSTFYRIDPGYSLCAVVLDQLNALLERGYKPVLFTLTIFKDDHLVPEGVEIRKVVPQLILEPYKGLGFPEHWKEDVRRVKEMVREHCADITHMICHDTFFIDTYLPYNVGMREAEMPFKIFAWTHSAPSQRPALEDNPHANRYTLPKNTKLVYLNHDKANDLAEMYGAWLKDVRIIKNARDPRTFWDLHPLVQKIYNEYSLHSADIISVYPLSTPRMISGKGLDRVIKIHSKLKQLGYETRLIIPNAHANAQGEKRLISETTVHAHQQGLELENLVFTSTLEAPEYELGVPPKVVSDLFRIANVFIFPTTSENSSLVLLEAMLSGNLLVLNTRVGTLREHAGESALYVDFDYREPRETNELYYLDLAKIIASQFEEDKSLQVKRRALKEFNYSRVGREIDILLNEI